MISPHRNAIWFQTLPVSIILGGELANPGFGSLMGIELASEVEKLRMDARLRRAIKAISLRQFVACILNAVSTLRTSGREIGVDNGDNQED
jgi:hypothetical protein